MIFKDIFSTKKGNEAFFRQFFPKLENFLKIVHRYKRQKYNIRNTEPLSKFLHTNIERNKWTRVFPQFVKIFTSFNNNKSCTETGKRRSEQLFEYFAPSWNLRWVGEYIDECFEFHCSLFYKTSFKIHIFGQIRKNLGIEKMFSKNWNK